MSARCPRDDEVALAIAGLTGLSRTELATRWVDLYGRPPPANLSQALMRKAVAHEMQVRALGGMRPATRRALRAALSGGGEAGAAPAMAPGTRLLRDWNGVTHEVDVLERGFRWRGETWRSLSRIAREITGTAWSGPRFFGLTSKR
ncbi:MAG: DUF2924 domain-containing protein [Pseudomonadota bacterium]